MSVHSRRQDGCTAARARFEPYVVPAGANRARTVFSVTQRNAQQQPLQAGPWWLTARGQRGIEDFSPSDGSHAYVAFYRRLNRRDGIQTIGLNGETKRPWSSGRLLPSTA